MTSSLLLYYFSVDFTFSKRIFEFTFSDLVGRVREGEGKYEFALASIKTKSLAFHKALVLGGVKKQVYIFAQLTIEALYIKL